MPKLKWTKRGYSLYVVMKFVKYGLFSHLMVVMNGHISSQQNTMFLRVRIFVKILKNHTNLFGIANA